MWIGVQGRISYVRARGYVEMRGCGRARWCGKVCVCQDVPVYVGTVVFEGAWMDRVAGLCRVTWVIQEKRGMKKRVGICKPGGPRGRVWELSGLRVIKRVTRDTNCVPKRVWKAETVLMETSFKG